MMTTAKQTILTAIRRHHLPEQAIPTLDQPWIKFADPLQQFAEVLESVGGRAIAVADISAIDGKLIAMPTCAEAKKVVSLVEGIRGTVQLNQINDAHATEDIDFSILPGELAVAENAAVWVSDAGVKHRAIYFIAQHLALVVSAKNIVHNMHEAYERLTFGEPRFGCFISGPSKTADIEQSLVIGAHGPRSLTVFLLLSPPSEGGARGG